VVFVHDGGVNSPGVHLCCVCSLIFVRFYKVMSGLACGFSLLGDFHDRRRLVLICVPSLCLAPDCVQHI